MITERKFASAESNIHMTAHYGVPGAVFDQDGRRDPETYKIHNPDMRLDAILGWALKREKKECPAERSKHVS